MWTPYFVFGDRHQDTAGFQFGKCGIQRGDGLALFLVAFQQGTVALDRAEPHLKRGHQAGKGEFERQLFMQPTGNLGAMAHHLRVIELPVFQDIDGLSDEGVELNDPSRLRVFRQLAPRCRRQAGKIRK